MVNPAKLRLRAGDDGFLRMFQQIAQQSTRGDRTTYRRWQNQTEQAKQPTHIDHLIIIAFVRGRLPQTGKAVRHGNG